jgi:large subunit ribosomal protein L10
VDRTQKEQTVAALHAAFAEAGLVVIAHQSGMTVAEVTALRRRMRDAGARFKVTKNRLARIALKGTQYEKLDGLFKGPTVVAYSVDPIAAAKVATDFAKTNEKFKILGGSLGAQTLDENGIKALAALPSLDELRAQLVGLIQTPATRIAGILQAPGGQVARVLAAYAKKDEAA